MGEILYELSLIVVINLTTTKKFEHHFTTSRLSNFLLKINHGIREKRNGFNQNVNKQLVCMHVLYMHTHPPTHPPHTVQCKHSDLRVLFILRLILIHFEWQGYSLYRHTLRLTNAFGNTTTQCNRSNGYLSRSKINIQQIEFPLSRRGREREMPL